MGDARGKTGTLYVVATPIGNLSDMSYRAVETLQSVTSIAAEDTRHTAKLRAHYAIDTPTTPYHEHNEAQQTPRLLQRLLAGEDIALVSDAGSPLISDPGFRLVSAARDAGVTVAPIPGPCAAIAALSAAGVACHRFCFEGFLPAKAGARRNRLNALRRAADTLVFYESGRRLPDTLRDMCDAFGEDRRAALARELTKLHETIRRDRLIALCDWLQTNPAQRKGEHVILVEAAASARSDDGEAVLEVLSEELPPGRAAELAARISGGSRNRLYKLALAKRKKHGDS